MKSTDVFHSYDFDEWQEGHNIKLEHTVYYSNDGTALLPLIKSSPEELRMLQKYVYHTNIRLLSKRRTNYLIGRKRRR